MKKLILIIAMLLLLTSATSLTVADDQDEKIYNQLTQYSIFYNIMTDVGDFGCSGTVLKKTKDHTYVLTAAHCVKGGTQALAEYKGHYSSAIYADADYDLALIVFQGNIKDKKVAKVSKDETNLFQDVYYVGYYEQTVRVHGRVFAIDLNGDRLFFGKVKQGCSGGGVFNTRDELVGVLVQLVKQTNHGVFEPLGHVELFLSAIVYPEGVEPLNSLREIRLK